MEIREARAADAEQLAGLIGLLGHEMTAGQVRERIDGLAADDLPQVVAVDGERVVGLCGLHRMTAIHRPQPVGRVTILVVAQHARGQGIGRQLMRAAEERLIAAGCRLVEVTSNDRLVEAHRFYERVGYERTSKRFARKLD